MENVSLKKCEVCQLHKCKFIKCKFINVISDNVILKSIHISLNKVYVFARGCDLENC